ncbi:Transmembrane and TPR repeat-containing protein 1 [Operophtera brumata]|uniref:Transmembrane and TPR repeat-containing protein 1 n=1 Tax=Operophtera brumata TaxID=104452 RepID=A0A0L7L9Q0_OPEBR|nr:Transmembrane and TPR repeat-containing protein 1 [Operophtera brumata]
MEYYATGMRLAFGQGSSRGELVSLRAAALALRSAGQHARILQLLTRLVPIAMEYYATGMRLAFSRGSSRGELVSLRAAALALRSAGQHARILQLLTRWHVVRDDGQSALRRELAARAWRLRTELAERAAFQLEVSPDSYIANVKQNESTDTRTLQTHAGVKCAHVDKVNKISCQKNFSKKSVSISAQYKHTHNKSETGHKQKSCPLHKKKNIKDPEAFPPFSDHLIKTY